MTSVLWYSNETPDVRGQGGQRRQYFQIRSLIQAGHDVSVVSLEGDQDDTSIGSLTQVRRLPGPRGRTRLSLPRRRDAAAGLLSAITCERLVIAHLESWLHLRRRRIALHRPRLLDVHNVFSHWYASQGRRQVSARWRRRERAAARAFDAVSVCSAREQQAFLRSAGQEPMVLPHGIEPTEWALEPRPRSSPVVKLFGNWDWEPNRVGLTWFLAEVVPRVNASSVKIEVAGRGTEHMSVADDVTFAGRVPDIPTFLADAWVVGLPVMSGVGAPVKFAEALVTGVPMMATEDSSDGNAPPDVLVSDDPAAWARRITEVVADPHGFAAASRERRTRIMGERSWDRVTEPLRRWVEEG